MSGIEEKAALEAIKPAAGFIDALLAPKVAKLKLWANEKELKGRLDPNKLPQIMEEYLVKLSDRVSEITSISFPLIKLNIFEAYEPLILGKLNYDNSTAKAEVELKELINESIKSCLIVDHAGMGKSTFSKFIVASLLFKSDRIPLFFELRKVNIELDLIDNLCKELDFPGNFFDRELFYKLLQLGKFYVILDGFDEVSLDHQETLSNQIHDLSLKGGDNIILLTSRPQEALPDIVKSEPLRFNPFTHTQAISLLKRYDDISGLNVGHDLTAQIDDVPKKFIESPLLVSLLYRTFGVNKSIAKKTCTFYEEIYHALYKGHDLINKNGYGREKKSNLDFEDFRKLLRAMCYFMMLNKKTSFENWSEAVKYIEKAASISSITPSSPSRFLDDLLVSVPLMLKEGTEIKFFHKTLLEYFSAEYLLFHKTSSTLVKKLFESKLASSFNKTFEFLFELNTSLFDSVITCHFAEKAKNLDSGTSLLEKSLTTLIFRKKCKIGLWEHEQYREELDGHDDWIFTGADQAELLELGYYTTTWNEGFLNGDKYFLALTYQDTSSNFHPCAWRSISTEIDVKVKRNKLSDSEMTTLQEVLGINNWLDLDFKLGAKLKGIENLLSIIISSISSERVGENCGPRVIAEDKVKTILDRVRKEEEFTEETDQFL